MKGRDSPIENRLSFTLPCKQNRLGVFWLVRVLFGLNVLFVLPASNFFFFPFLLLQLFLALFVFIVYFDQVGILFSGILRFEMRQAIACLCFYYRTKWRKRHYSLTSPPW